VNRVRRFDDIPGFGIDRVAAAAGDDPEVLRLENLDTDIPPPAEAVAATRDALPTDDANSWLPFNGRDDLKAAVAAYIERRGGPHYDPRRQVVITGGEGEAMLDALLVLTDPGDEVILTDPTYAGMLNRVRLAGAVPRLVPLHASADGWRLDMQALKRAATSRTRVVFLNNASFPTGWVASEQEWEAVARLCNDADLWLLYWGAYEAVLFDGRRVIHPASLPGMRERTVIVGAPSCEQRMIAWRVGWMVVPPGLADVASRAQIYNGLVASGFAQIGVRVALDLGDDDVAAATAEWERRRDETLRQLAGLPVVPPHGAWSALLDARELGMQPAELSARLLEERVAATPMNGWGGDVAGRYLRVVFSNEPIGRLRLLGDRVRAALA
jgi:N-succinyldiaminopimelate aminotransferase